MDIHPSNKARIERECAVSRADARSKAIAGQRRQVAYWTELATESSTTRRQDAYCEENARLHALMLAALEADAERVREAS